MRTVTLPFGITVIVRDALKQATIEGDELRRHIGQEYADVVESMILAQAAEGVDITTKEYAKALETSVEAIVNNLC